MDPVEARNVRLGLARHATSGRSPTTEDLQKFIVLLTPLLFSKSPRNFVAQMSDTGRKCGPFEGKFCRIINRLTKEVI